MSSNQISIGVILINRPRSFQKFGVTATVLSDCYKTILTFVCTYFSRLPPKTIIYRSFRYFETRDFLYKLENKLRTKEFKGRVKYDDLTNIFWSTLYKSKIKWGEIKLLLCQKSGFTLKRVRDMIRTYSQVRIITIIFRFRVQAEVSNEHDIIILVHNSRQW